MSNKLAKKFFEYHLRKYGKDDIRGMGWHEEDEYSVRFDIISNIGDLHKSSILDVGCGFGGLYKWLISNKIKGFKYLGVDIVEKMVQTAREKNPTGKFMYADILEDELGEFDYVFCIGTLNVGREGYSKFVKKMISKMISIAKKGVALSFLSESKYLVKGPYHFEDASKLKKWIMENFKVKVKIVNDSSLMGETIMFIYK